MWVFVSVVEAAGTAQQLAAVASSGGTISEGTLTPPKRDRSVENKNLREVFCLLCVRACGWQQETAQPSACSQQVVNSIPGGEENFIPVAVVTEGASAARVLGKQLTNSSRVEKPPRENYDV